MRTIIEIGMIRLVGIYLRHTPIEWGRWRFISLVLPILRKLGSMMGSTVITTRHGFQFHCRLDDWLSQYVWLTGSYERMTSLIMIQLMRSGDIAIDVGANVGYFSLLLAQKAGLEGHVYAFEPVPSLQAEIDQNIKLNKLSNITVIQAAATDQDGELTIYEGPSDHRGISSLRPLNNASQLLNIRGMRLDNHLLNLPSLRLIKIDVEGAEQLALSGMTELIVKFHPYIILEFTDAYLSSFGASTASLESWLLERDYSLYRITNERLIDLDTKKQELPFQYNVLCIPSQILPSELLPYYLKP